MLNKPTALFWTLVRFPIRRTNLWRVVRSAISALALALLLFAPLSARAQFVVSDCSEEDLAFGLEGGGQLEFDGDCEITLTGP